MSYSPAIINQLRADGERITPLRVALISLLAKIKAPLTPREILRALAKKGFKVNKTTIYRQLEALTRYNLVQKIRLADRTDRYEIVSDDDHHHHLVCLTCDRIEDVSFPTDLKKQELVIWKKNKFKVLRHSLEFFGLCKACQKKST